MCSLKQKELTLDAVLQMNEQICNDCIDAAGCKRYIQWLRLNPIHFTTGKTDPDSNDAVIYDRPFYRSRAEEIFW